MNLPIYLREDRSCAPKQLLIGYRNEKNIDKIILNVDPNLPPLKWYLNFNDLLFPFVNGELAVTEELTEQAGNIRAYILGSNAKENSPITDGSIFFCSDVIFMKVGDR